MQKLLAFVSCLIVVCLCNMAFAFESKIINEIPNRYALLLITDVDPDQPLDKDAVLAFVRQERDKLNVEQFQFAVYDKGKKMGEGLRVFGEKWKNKKEDNFQISNEVAGKFIESLLGYNISPQEIYNAYIENEVAADEDFANNNVLVSVTVPKVEKDSYGIPNIKIPLDKSGSKLFQIYIDKKDPFLRKLKRGSDILIKVRARGFVMGRVVVDGVIIRDSTSYRLGDKLFTPPTEDKATEDKRKK